MSTDEPCQNQEFELQNAKIQFQSRADLGSRAEATHFTFGYDTACAVQAKPVFASSAASSAAVAHSF
eukprot:8314234-Pyramimonas_sp.AAC.1